MEEIKVQMPPRKRLFWRFLYCKADGTHIGHLLQMYIYIGQLNRNSINASHRLSSFIFPCDSVKTRNEVIFRKLNG